MEYSDLLAKVLANENLTVQRGAVKTASFDIKNRILTLPTWKDMDDQLETMLILHEVGHALFTPARYMELARESKALASAINVVEDPREERLMKERYPGSRKDFVAGYKVIREKDIMEIKDQDVNSLNLLDRINVFFKAGIGCGVKFSQEEYPFVNRCQTIVTFEEAEQLARDIIEYMKSRNEEVPSGEGETITILIPSEDGEKGEVGEQGDVGDWKDSNPIGSYDDEDGDGEKSEKEIISETMEKLNNALQDSASDPGEVSYIEISDDFKREVVVSYKDILNHIEGSNKEYYDETHLRTSNNDFKTKFKTQVSHLVAQFELRKSAAIYALRSIHKSGVLDTRKLASYKVKEDIFRRNIKTPEGQNHGMILLLDWSQSMYSNGTIYRSLEQVQQLVMFCRSVGIPHRVYCFADSIRLYNPDARANNGTNYLSLLEMFSSDMTLKEYNRMSQFVTSNLFMKRYPLGNTPLAPALAYMQQIVPEFKAKHKIDKLNLVTFTDGANTHRLINIDRKGSTYITDKVTKKNYKLHTETGCYKNWRETVSEEVNILYRILRDRYNITTTSFFAAAGRFADNLQSSGVIATSISPEYISRLEKEYSKNGFVRLTGYGRDAIYIVKNSILWNEEFQVDVDSNMSASKIASTLKKASKSSVKGKILVEKIAETIS